MSFFFELKYHKQSLRAQHALGQQASHEKVVTAGESQTEELYEQAGRRNIK